MPTQQQLQTAFNDLYTSRSGNPDKIDAAEVLPVFTDLIQQVYSQLTLAEVQTGTATDAKSISAAVLKQAIESLSLQGNVNLNSTGTSIETQTVGDVTYMRFKIEGTTVLELIRNAQDQHTLNVYDQFGDSYFSYEEASNQVLVGGDGSTVTLSLGTLEADNNEVRVERRLILNDVTDLGVVQPQALVLGPNNRVYKADIAAQNPVESPNTIIASNILTFQHRESYKGLPTNYFSGPLTDSNFTINVSGSARPGYTEIVRYKSPTPPTITVNGDNPRAAVQLMDDLNALWPGDVDVDLIFILRAAGSNVFFVDVHLDVVATPNHIAPRIEDIEFTESPILPTTSGIEAEYSYVGSFPERIGGSVETWEKQVAGVWEPMTPESDGTYSVAAQTPTPDRIRVTFIPESVAGETSTAVQYEVVVGATAQPVTWSNLLNMTQSGNSLTSAPTNTTYDAGAFSNESIIDGQTGYFEWQHSELVDMSIGLSRIAKSGDYDSADDPEYQVRLNESGEIQQWSPGAFNGVIGTYSPNDLIRLELDQSGASAAFSVKLNGSTIYSATFTKDAFFLHIATRRPSETINEVFQLIQ